MQTRKTIILDAMQLQSGSLGVEVHTLDDTEGAIHIAARQHTIKILSWEINDVIKVLNKAKRLLKSEIGDLERGKPDEEEY